MFTSGSSFWRCQRIQLVTLLLLFSFLLPSFSFAQDARQLTNDLLEADQRASELYSPYSIAYKAVAGASLSCVTLTKALFFGSKDVNTAGEVSKLQQFLAQDSTLYPEGEITGFYGRATERAVQRFQVRNNIVSGGSREVTGYGMVGSKTRNAIARACTSATTVPPEGVGAYALTDVKSVTKETVVSSTHYVVILKNNTSRTVIVPPKTSSSIRTTLFKASGYTGSVSKLIAKVKKLKVIKSGTTPKPSRSGGGSKNSVPLAPVCDSFTVTPASLSSIGGSVTLAWDTSNADSASIDQSVGTVEVDGTKSLSVTTTKTFTLTTMNSSGSVTCTAVVTVLPSSITPFALTDVANITSKVVGLNTIYSLTLTTGRKLDVTILTLATIVVRDKAFATAGYTGSVASLLAKLPNTLLGVYIETPIRQAQMCSERWHQNAPSSPPAELGTATTPPFKYEFDFANKRHLNHKDLYGYNPTYKPGQVSFSAMGQALIKDRSFNMQYTDTSGKWQKINLIDIAKASLQKQGITWQPAPQDDRLGPTRAYANQYVDGRIVYDGSCNAYTILSSSRSSLGVSILLHSFDGGHSWAAYKIPGSAGGAIVPSIEVPMAQHTLKQTQPPAILLIDAYNNLPLKMVVPIKNADKTLSFSNVFTVAEKSVAISPAGGGETFIASNGGDNLHIVYSKKAVMRDEISGHVGVPQYAVTLSRTTGAIVSGPTLIGVGVGSSDATAPDNHNQPSIAQDAQGYLHVVIGGHGGPIYYRKSSNPNDTSSWGPIETVGVQPTDASPGADQYTYPSLVIAGGTTPLIVARWSGERYVFQLVSIQRSSSGIWTQKVILNPGRAYYGHWYNKLSVDAWGKVFLNFSYYVGTNLFAEEVEAFRNTYGLNLSDPHKADGTAPCTPTSKTASPANYCNYHKGDGRIGEGVLLLRTPSSNFEFLTTEKLFK